MHEDIVRRAAMPIPRVVLGLLLKPYSIGHELLIQTGPKFETVEGALAGAVWLCANTWQENTRLRFDLFARLKIFLWRVRSCRCDMAQETLKLAEYRDEGSLEFPLSDVRLPDAPSGRMCGASFLFSLHQWVRLNFHLKEDEAWDYKFGLAKIHWMADQEERGLLRIQNEHEVQFDAYIAEQERKGMEQCQA